MSFDNYFSPNSGLLINRSGPINEDGGDSAQMTGMYRFGKALTIKRNTEQHDRECARFNQELDILTHTEGYGSRDLLGVVHEQKTYPGTYVRHPKPCYPGWAADPKVFSRDQTRSLYMAMGELKQKKKLIQLTWQQVKRFSFYQNTHEIDGKKKFCADVMAPDHAAEIIRAWFSAGFWFVALLYPLVLLGDVCALLGFISNMIQWRNPEEADDDNLVMSILQAQRSLPTPLSWLHRKLYKNLRPRTHETDKAVSGPQSALNYKHREATGSPPLAVLYEPILKEYL